MLVSISVADTVFSIDLIAKHVFSFYKTKQKVIFDDLRFTHTPTTRLIFDSSNY